MTHDVTIIGAGIVGLTTACALAQKTRLSIVVIDTKPITPTWSAATYHSRVSAIALSSKRIFQNLGVWQSIKEKRVSAFDAINVWDQSTKATIDFRAAEVAEARLGYIIENNAMQDALLERLQQFPQISIHTGDSTLSSRAASGSGSSAFSASLTIGADGANSWVRQQANIRLNTEDYGHDAIVATVRTTLPHDKTARQVFLATGPLAFLPLQEADLSSIVWSMPPEDAQKILALDDDEFKTALTSAFANTLGDVIEVSKRFSFPLKKRRAERYIADRIALVGDAAHTVHPLAGQGLNVGLLDAAALVDVIVDAIKHNRDIGALHTLRRYERWRKGENALMLNGVDAIKTVFCTNKQITKALRSFGLNMTNQLPILKNLFTRHAVGSGEGLPLLAR